MYWKEKEKDKKVVANRKNKEYQTKPYLFFDNGIRGLCLVLPRTILTNEWVEEVSWTITCNGFCKIIYCNVLGDEGKRYTDSICVAVPPSERYIVELHDSEGLEEKENKEWIVEDIKRDKILFFNENGRQVNSLYLLSPYEIMIIPDSVKIVKTVSLDLEEQYYPTIKGGYRFIAATPLGTDASLTYWANGGLHNISVRPQVNMSLEGTTLFSLDSSTGMFTKIPVLHITMDGMIQTGGMELRIGGKLIPIELTCEKDNVFTLSKIAASEFRHYGTYSVRLYQFGRFPLKK